MGAGAINDQPFDPEVTQSKLPLVGAVQRQRLVDAIDRGVGS